MRPKLMQMDDGNWIHPREVRAIEAVEEHNCQDPDCGCGCGRYPPAVFVTTVRGRQTNRYVFPCEKYEDAEMLRDSIAAQVNNNGHPVPEDLEEEEDDDDE